MLEVSHIDTFHGAAQALRDVSFSVASGEIAGLMGRNGAGKTTMIRTIMGLLKPRRGRIVLNGEDVTRLAAHDIPKRGVAYVPQGRRLFNGMTVEDNLRMGLAVRNGSPAVLAGVLQLLPLLKQRLNQRAGTLSGGEQQMLAMARALCTEPALILLDEPSEGLAPEIVDRLLDTMMELKQRGVAVVLVEQRVKSALKVCDRILFMENGTIQHEASAGELAADPVPLERYIGVH
ncbi:MAG: ABC transporter ATP-binding protein, partial [Rhizobiales bacterium]|nr:ABC transporter ATP-binding protein [Hyphomicrobiales bacterium]